MALVKAYGGESPFIFVSYSHSDREEVEPVIAYLQRLGYNVWFDEGLPLGQDWAQTLDARIGECECFLCFISTRSVGSPECEKEIRRALDTKRTMVNVFLEPVELAPSVADEMMRVQGIERFRIHDDSAFYIKLLESRLFESCRDTEEFQIDSGNLVRYNGKASAVTVPVSVTQIGYNAFEGCSHLQLVSIPAGVDRIGKFAFNDTPALHRFEVEQDNGFFRSIDGVLYNKSKNYLLAYPTARPGEVYSIPEGVKYIALVAFAEANVLTWIDMPDGVIYVGDRAFEACRNLVHVRVSESLTRIRPYTFSRCTSLVGCDLPAALEDLGDGVFSGCSSLEQIDLPAGLTCIGEMAFAHCGALKGVALPAGLREVPAYGFHECSSLATVDFANVRRIAPYAFKNCDALTDFVLPGTLEDIGRAAFSGCDSLTRLKIPGSVRSIGEYAFDRCPRLETVEICEGVREICEGAFDKDESLRRVLLPDSVETVHPQAFPVWTEVVR